MPETYGGKGFHGLANLDYLSEIQQIDGSWDFNRSAADMVERFYREANYDKYALRIHDCARRLNFNLETNLQGDSRLRLKSVFLCHLRLCPICQKCRSRSQKKRIDAGINAMLQQNPNQEFIFLTLTIKNCKIENLKKTLGHLQRGWSKLAKRKEFIAMSSGYLRTLEICKSKIYEAHPHYHALISARPSYFGKAYLSHSELQKIWGECLGIDYHVQVDIRRIYQKKAKKIDGTNIEKAIKEICKYMIKVPDLIGKGSQRDKNYFIELGNQIKNNRQIMTSGLFKKHLKELEIKEEDILLGAIDEKDDENEFHIQDEISFNWFEYHKKYARFKSL